MRASVFESVLVCVGFHREKAHDRQKRYQR